MKKLFIIGNGFDISHGLPTRYCDFQKYLKKEYPEASEDIFTVPEPFFMPDGEEKYNDNEVVGFLLRVITEAEGNDGNWCDLEKTLGELNFDDFFCNYFEEDENEWHNVYRNEDIAASINGATKLIKRYFSDWVNTISICGSPKPKFNNLINPETDLFLNFNYTETLEKIYNAKNVYHIHGKQGGELIFGHGNDIDYYDDYMAKNIGSELYLSELQWSLRKDTEKALDSDEIKPLFNDLHLVEEIYSYGFSYSDVDMVYIKKICQSVSSDSIVWYLHSYDNSKADIVKSKIRTCGFDGNFDVFSS